MERGGAERGGRTAPVRLLLDGRDREGTAVEIPRECGRLRLVQPEYRVIRRTGAAEVPALRDALAVDGDEARFERTGLEGADHVPVRGDDEANALQLAVDDEPGGDRLHATRREAAHDLLPEHGRHLVAVQPVEDATRLLGVDKPHVHVSRLVERADDRVLRDLVEHHAAHWHLGPQLLHEMPGDGLALTILVCREQELVGLCELLLERGHDLLLVRIDHVVRLEVVLDSNAQRAVLLALGGRNLARLFGQVADVADARLDVVAGAEVTRDRPRFRGGLDDDELLLSGSHTAGHVSDEFDGRR